MILRQEPKDKCSLVMVDSETSKILHTNGFIPNELGSSGSIV